MGRESLCVCLGCRPWESRTAFPLFVEKHSPKILLMEHKQMGLAGTWICFYRVDFEPESYFYGSVDSTDWKSCLYKLVPLWKWRLTAKDRAHAQGCLTGASVTKDWWGDALQASDKLTKVCLGHSDSCCCTAVWGSRVWDSDEET